MSNTTNSGADMSDANWVLAIDFGTSYTVAASRIEGRSAEVIEVDGERRIPSVILLDDNGEIMVGRTAETLAASHPGRVLRAPKSRLGEPAPVVLGGRPHQIADLVAALLEYVYTAAVAYHGNPPAEVRLTHPATWSGPRRQQLVAAARTAGIADPVLVPEPVAAAIAYADDVAIEHDQHVLVYDLGGGTFDTAALQASPNGFVVMGRPGGDPRLGGELFDELLANSIGETLDPAVYEQLQIAEDPLWVQAATGLRSEARRIKEALSTHPYADLVLGLPDGLIQQRVEQTQLHQVISPYIAESVDVMQQTASGAGLTSDDLASIYLVGGASRTPLVEQLVTEAYPDVKISRRGDPKGVVAIGATHPMATPTTLAQRSSLDRASTLESPAPPPPAAPAAAPASPPAQQPATPTPPPPVPGGAVQASPEPTSVERTVVDGGTVIDTGTVADVASVAANPTVADAPVGGAAGPASTAPTGVQPDGGSGDSAPNDRTKVGLGIGVAALLGLGVFGISTLGSDDDPQQTDSTITVATTTASSARGDTIAPITTTPGIIETTPTVAPTTVAPATTPATTTTTTVAAPVRPTDAEIQASLLRASDLDSVGWVDVADDDPILDVDAEAPICGIEETFGQLSQAISGVQNANGSFRYLVHSIGVYDSPESAKATFDSAFEVNSICPATTEVDGITYDLIADAQRQTAEDLGVPCADDAAFIIYFLTTEEDAFVTSLAQAASIIRCGSNMMVVSHVLIGGIEELADVDFAAASTKSALRLNNLPGSN